MRLTIASPDAERTVLVKVDDDTRVDQLAAAIGVPVPALTGVPSDTATGVAVSESPVLNGAVVPEPAVSTPVAGTPRIEIVGGPFAGQQVSFGSGGEVLVGSGTNATVRIADRHLQDVHARIVVAFDEPAAPGRPRPLRGMIEPASGATVLCNGTPVTGSTPFAPIDLLQLGSTLLRIGLTPASDADITKDPQGMRGFNRPSRIVRPATPPLVTLPGDRPDDSDTSPLPWLSAIIPVVLGVTMALVFNRPIMLMMAAASPIMVVGSYVMNRRLAARKGERTDAEWAEEVRTTKERIAEIIRVQRVESWHDHPDPLHVRDIATGPSARLWERRTADADALQFRVGAGEVPLSVQFQGGSRSDDVLRVDVSPAPIAVNLGAGPVGIAGAAVATRSVARALLAAIATLRSPRDLQLVALCEDDAEAEWSWLSWLPHLDPTVGPVALLGNTDDTRRDRLRELTALVQNRLRGGGAGTQVLVLIDGARDLRRLPGMTDLLRDGTAVGVHVIAIDSDRTRLPEECRSLLVVDDLDPSLGRLETADRFVPAVLLDGLSLADSTTIARSLCSIEHVSAAGDERMLPSSVRLVDVLAVDLDDAPALLEHWNASPRRSFVSVGATAESEFAIDLVADGPHALIAGTTGSGKSEFLQTLVVSLALANRPDAMNFVLVDYKGGSAFADCERLPHTVGMVTNLDARETERALASLDAELKRRERVLSDMGAKDVDAAWTRDPDTASRNRLARLVLVVDEFAELRAELPEFITGLVRIARVGRSLGVHLILATQRPSGVVTPEMQSNINLRVALRVTDRADSTDVLGAPDAATIPPSLRGRGFVRSTSGGLPAAFQTARVAGLRRGATPAEGTALSVAELHWEDLGQPVRFPRSPGATGPVDHDDTDLRALVDLAIDAAAAGGIERNPSPWLVPLPPVLTLDRFRSEHVPDGAIVLGMQDLPAEQTQRPLLWNPASEGHLLFIGGARSGRTTTLRGILGQAITRYTPADLHLYIADYGNGALLPLAEAPHTGAVITPTDTQRLPRLLDRLLSELEHRQTTLSAAGVGSIGEQRRGAAPDAALPYAIFAVDGWERLVAGLGADQLLSVREQIMRVLREGPSAGIRVIITADRTFTGDKIASAIDAVYLLPMRDPNDYRAAGVMLRELPALVPGRALFGGEANEAQLVILGRDTSGEGQGKRLRTVIERSREYYDRFPQLALLPRAFRVDPLPSYIGLAAAGELPVLPGLPGQGPVYAVGGDELSRLTVAWQTLTGFVAAGGRGTGRSTVLAALMTQLHEAGRGALVIAPRASVLTETAARFGIEVLADAATEAGAVATAVDSLILRHPEGPVTVIVDDAETLKQTPVESGISGVSARVSIAVAVESEAVSTLFGGALPAAKRHRAGIVLGATNPMVGTTLFGLQIPKTMMGGRSPGLGAAFVDGGWMPARAADVRQ